MDLLGFHFHSPLAFLLLFWILRFPELRRRQVQAEFAQGKLLFSSPVILAKLPKTWRQRTGPTILSALRIVAFLTLVVALARPQSETSFEQGEDSGRDIMLALDISGSMQAADFSLDGQPATRLQALKYVTKKFIDGRPGDRIGLIVFADYAFTQCPLTLDHEVVKSFIDRLEIGMAGTGTAIGDALGISLKRLRDLDAQSKVIVLVTDGKNNSGSLGPLESADIAKKLNIKIHTVGIGGNGFAPVPMQGGLFGFTQYVNQRMEFDEETLKKIASQTGGKYFNAKTTDAFAEVYAEIDKLEPREDKSYRFVQYEELFLPWVLLSLLCFAGHELLVRTLFLRLP